MASSTVGTRPIASNTKSGPPSVRSRSASIVVGRSSGDASRPSVAPSARATSSFASTRSMATIRDGTGERGAHHARQADATQPDDRHARPGRHLGGLEDRPDAGRDAAADERRDGRIHAVGQRDGGRRRARPSPRPSSRSRSRTGPARRRRGTEDGRAVGQPVAERRGVGAGPRPAGPARPAGAARHEPGQRDRLPDRTARERPARPPRRRRRPRGPSRSASGAASRRRGRAGRSGRRPRPGSGPGPRRPAARRRSAPRPSTGSPGVRRTAARVVVTSRSPRRRSAWRAGDVRDVRRPPHRAVDQGVDVGRRRRSRPARPSTASRATPIAIARVTARRSPTGG